MMLYCEQCRNTLHKFLFDIQHVSCCNGIGTEQTLLPDMSDNSVSALPLGQMSASLWRAKTP